MKQSQKTILALFIFGLLAGSCVDVYDIAWGTGIWLGEFALTWAVLLILFCFCCLLALVVAVRVIWDDTSFNAIIGRLIGFRSNLKGWRWLLVAAAFIFPLWLLQFTVLGIVFKGLFLRLSLW